MPGMTLAKGSAEQPPTMEREMGLPLNQGGAAMHEFVRAVKHCWANRNNLSGFWPALYDALNLISHKTCLGVFVAAPGGDALVQMWPRPEKCPLELPITE